MRDFWRGKITLREMWTLVMQLPGESRFKATFAAAQEQREAAEHDAAVEAAHAGIAERNKQREAELSWLTPPPP